MVNTPNWDKFSRRIVLGLIVSAVGAAMFLLFLRHLSMVSSGA